MHKQRLREQARRRPPATAEARREAAAAIAQRLRRLEVFRNARTVGGFLALADEPPVLEELWRGDCSRVWAVPAWDVLHRRYRFARWPGPRAQRSRGPDGVLQPDPPRWVAPTRLEAVLVPGLAFDRYGHRLGRGGGHYDRLLARCRCPVIGVAWDSSIVDCVPVRSHDQSVGWIVTERRTIRCTPPHRPQRPAAKRGAQR